MINVCGWLNQFLAAIVNTTGSVCGGVGGWWVGGVAGCAPHLCVPGRGGSSHPSQAGGPGCQERPEPEGQIQRPSQGGCRAAAGLKGVGAAGLGGRGRHGRGAEPAAAAAVNKCRETGDKTEGKWVGWEVNPWMSALYSCVRAAFDDI